MQIFFFFLQLEEMEQLVADARGFDEEYEVERMQKVFKGVSLMEWLYNI